MIFHRKPLQCFHTTTIRSKDKQHSLQILVLLTKFSVKQHRIKKINTYRGKNIEYSTL